MRARARWNLSAMIAVVIICVVSSTIAYPPGKITYQGKLTDPLGNPVPDGSYSISFRVYDHPVNPTPVWWEEIHNVTTKNGLFDVVLGSDFDLDWGTISGLPAVYLGIKVGDDPEITPRVAMTSVLFAQEANRAYNVTTINLATGGTIEGPLHVTDSLTSEGNATIAGRLSVGSNAGPSAKPALGERWRDNAIVAWAHVGSQGELWGAFGVDSVQHVSIGHYLVYLGSAPSNWANTVALAQAYSNIENHILTSVNVITASRIDVGTKLFNINDFFDSDFVLIVTGR